MKDIKAELKKAWMDILLHKRNFNNEDVSLLIKAKHYIETLEGEKHER